MNKLNFKHLFAPCFSPFNSSILLLCAKKCGNHASSFALVAQCKGMPCRNNTNRKLLFFWPGLFLSFQYSVSLLCCILHNKQHTYLQQHELPFLLHVHVNYSPAVFSRDEHRIAFNQLSVAGTSSINIWKVYGCLLELCVV